MVIFMPYYRQHARILHIPPRSRTLSTPLHNNQDNNNNHSTRSTLTTNIQSSANLRISACKFISSILCRWLFSLFLFAIAVFLFQLSLNDRSNKKEGSNIVAAILCTVAVVSFLRTCQALRSYLTIINTRRRLIQRLRERQRAYNLALTHTSDSANSDIVIGDHADLPSYKELFPSHLDVSNIGDNESSALSPPSYDDFVKNLIIRQTTTSIGVSPNRPHALSLPNTTNLSSTITTTTTQNNPSRCIWITDRSRRPNSVHGTVSYV